MLTVEDIKTMIISGNEKDFYRTQEWQELRARILKEQRNECQICKKAGRVKRYEGRGDKRRLVSTVHHIKEVRDYPNLALEPTNLIVVCKHCHNVLHGRDYSQRNKAAKDKQFTTPERW